MADYTDVRESLVAAMETQSQLVSLMGEVRGHVRTGHDAVDTILAIRTNNFIHEPQQASVPELARTALTEADMAFQKGNNAKVPATTSQQRVDGALGTSSNSAAREACAMAATQVETLGQVPCTRIQP